MISNVTKDIVYVGVNDHSVDLFEGQYVVPNGMSYNSYVIVDDKIAVVDTVDAHFTHEWLDNVSEAIGSRKPDSAAGNSPTSRSASCLSSGRLTMSPSTSPPTTGRESPVQQSTFGHPHSSKRASCDGLQ